MWKPQTHKSFELCYQTGIESTAEPAKKWTWEHTGEEQLAFMPGKGARNGLFILRMLSERAIEMQGDLYVYFINYEKAFDDATC